MRAMRAAPYGVVLAVATIVVALDQLTKQLALNALADGPVELIDGVLTLRLAYNSGGAFGLLQGIPGFFLVATLVVVALILLWVRNVDDIGALVPLGMILGGGLGNVFDRLFRDLGGRVVDFVDVGWWPVFNLADSCIVTGVGLILLVGVRSRPPGSDEARARG